MTYLMYIAEKLDNWCWFVYDCNLASIQQVTDRKTQSVEFSGNTIKH